MHEESDTQRPDLDRLIDAALGAYAGADSGLEQRVLKRVAAERVYAPRFGRVIWAAALAAAACLLLIFILLHARPGPAPQSNARNTPTLRPAPAETAGPRETASVAPQPTQRPSRSPQRVRPEHAPGRLMAAALPKQQFFPAPRPLSSQERALVNFATQAPAPARDSFVAALQQADAPIAIADLHIAPIQIPPLEPPQPGTN